MFPQDDDDMRPPIVGDVDAVKAFGAFAAEIPDAPKFDPAMFLPKVNATPEGVADGRPMTLQEINALSIGYTNAANVLVSKIVELQKAVEKMLRTAFEAGEDVSEFTAELVKPAAKKAKK